MKNLPDLNNDQKADIKRIKELTSKNPEYAKAFIKIYLNSDLPHRIDKENFWNSLQWVTSYIKHNRQQLKNYLPKNIIEYESFEELTDDITAIQDKVTVKKEFISNLPSKLRKGISVKELSNDDIAAILNFLDKPRNQFRPPEISNSFNQHLRYIKKRLQELEDNPNLKLRETLTGIALKNKGNEDIQLVWDKNNIMVFRTINPIFIQEFGSHRWCITHSPGTYFLNYVNPALGYTQYLIFNLNIHLESPKFRIGISLDRKGTPLHGGCQDNFNSNVSFSRIKKDFGIPEGIIVPYRYSGETIQRFDRVFNITLSYRAKNITKEMFLELKDILLLNSDAFLNSTRNNKLFRLFIDNGVDVNIKNIHRNTALHKTAELNDTKKMKVLLENGAAIDARNRDSKSPLALACDRGNYNAIKFLIDAGANTSGLTINMHTPLSLNCSKDNLPVIKYFTDNINILGMHFRDIGSSNKGGASGSAGNIIKHLLKNGAYPNSTAVNNDELKILKQFLALDKNMLKNPGSEKLLLYAVEKGYTDTALFLIKNGIDISYKDKKGHNAFIKAVIKGQKDTVQALIPFNININEQIEGKEPPLIHAIRNRRFELAEILIDNGADINLKDNEGNTALHAACRNNSLHLAELLLKKGADIKAKNKFRLSPLNVTQNKNLMLMLLRHVNRSTTHYLKTKQPVRLP